LRHRRGHRHLGRVTSHRLRLLQHLAEALFRSYQIITTIDNAKEARPFAEKLISLAKKGGPQAQRQVGRVIHDKLAYFTLFQKIGPLYAERPGGYTRVLHLGRRSGDGAEMAVWELVDREKLGSPPGKPPKAKQAPKEKEKVKEKEGAGASRK